MDVVFIIVLITIKNCHKIVLSLDMLVISYICYPIN